MLFRSNLIGVGVLPLQFAEGQSVSSLGLSGREYFDIAGLAELKPGQELEVRARDADDIEKRFKTIVRIDSLVELDYYRHGGILQLVLRKLLRA